VFVDDPGFQDAVGLFRQGCSLAAIRTFSKIYGIAGLRVGYAVVPEELFQRLLRRGLIIRPLGSFAMPRHIRITVGTREENGELLKALAEEL
jgi:histidinol-phosphate aminotransferase